MHLAQEFGSRFWAGEVNMSLHVYRSKLGNCMCLYAHMHYAMLRCIPYLGFRCGYFPMENSSVMHPKNVPNLITRHVRQFFTVQDSSIWSSTPSSTICLHSRFSYMYTCPTPPPFAPPLLPISHIHVYVNTCVTSVFIYPSLFTSSLLSSLRSFSLSRALTVGCFVTCSPPNLTESNFVLLSVPCSRFSTRASPV